MKILIRDEAGIRELEEGFANESELQRFLMAHADLMPLEDIDLSAPPLLCIGWEVGVVSGAEDILYIDTSGLLTVVETKLRKNPESRREVVGQILEYAAQMSTWTSSDVERQAQAFFASAHSPDSYRGQSLSQAIEAHAVGSGYEDFDYDQFLKSIQEYIDDGHFRLVIAIDEPPAPLLKTAEFVNRFSRHFELYLVHLKRFSDSITKADIFVPAIFGRVATTPSGSGPRPTRIWDHDSFFEVLRNSQDDVVVRYVTAVYDKFEELPAEPYWGSGTAFGTYNLVAEAEGLRVKIAQLTSRGDLYVYFGKLCAKGFTNEATTLASELNAIDGITVTGDLAHKYPTIPRPVLRDSQKLDKVLAAIEASVQRLRQ